MLKKLLRREKTAVSEVEPLETLLAEAFTPVTPRSEFVAALEERLLRAYPQAVPLAEASPLAPLTGFGTALKRYTSAQVTLNRWRVWRGLLAIAIFLLSGRRALAGSKS